MKALHICSDHNFIEDSRKIFEMYNSGDNVFVVNTNAKKLTMIKNEEGLIKLPINKKENVFKLIDICKQNEIKAIVLHGIPVASEYYVIKTLKEKINCKLYWIFWGYELYSLLGYENNYPLIDTKYSILDKEKYLLPGYISKFFRKIRKRYLPATIKKSLPFIDYFCFWNREDYDLLLKYYSCSIEYKFFAYSANFKESKGCNLFPIREERSLKIMINHQASFYGNHDTIFNKIAAIDKDNLFTKVVPLSYGNKIIKEKVLKLGNNIFGSKFCPILDYMPKEEYFNVVNNMDVAIFGQKRQEASGNIIQMLKNGTKVFLRNDNNLLNYYRKQGYNIYSFEEDLKSMDDLKPLSLEEKEHNRKCYLENLIYYDDFMPNFFD